MEEALERSQGNSHDLKVSILLDYTRGSRGCCHWAEGFSSAQSTEFIILMVFCGSCVQARSTRGPCCCRCCGASPLRCGFPCTTLRTWGGCWGCWSLSASTRPSESSTSRSTCSTTASSSAGVLKFSPALRLCAKLSVFTQSLFAWVQTEDLAAFTLV